MTITTYLIGETNVGIIIIIRVVLILSDISRESDIFMGETIISIFIGETIISLMMIGVIIFFIIIFIIFVSIFIIFIIIFIRVL